MRVKLSYTAEIDDVLAEAAFLLGNLADTFQESNDLYSEIITHLKDEEFNPNKFHESIDTLRQNLGKIDTRCTEIDQVVAGFGDYQRQERDFSPGDSSLLEDSSAFAEESEGEVASD